VRVLLCAKGFSRTSGPDRLASGKKQEPCEQRHVEELCVEGMMSF